MAAAHTYTLTALTDIWTGDASGKGERLITTGLLGSIRWWFEVVVRGLGGSACDPTGGTRCPDVGKEPTEAGHHCVVCELFGCTDWARKFRFDVLDGTGQPQQDQIKAGCQFQLRFTPLRPIADEEWALLDVTIRLIAEYGAIGGKTVFKPSDEPNRQTAPPHKDFGLTKLEGVDSVALDRTEQTEQHLRQYVKDSRWRGVDHDDFAWASLQNFWCVKGRYLARQNANQSSFNQVIGRKQAKRQAQQLDQNNDINRWLAERQQESKKVFSFKDPECARRTFGFVQSANEFHEMKQRLKQKAWNDLKDNEFMTGGAILWGLLGRGGSS